MTRILLSGCLGKMGKIISDTIKSREGCEVVAGLDVNSSNELPYPVFDDIKNVPLKPDVIIDFSHPSALNSLLSYATTNKIPIVLCTTGYSAEGESKIKKAASETAVFYSRNMSLGINLLIELSKKAATILGEGFDVEIVEKHHNQKIDAPSGTAIMIADSINSSQNNRFNYMYDRHSVRKKRDKDELGIQSLRGGTIVGEHEVVFAGNDEIITIKHQALSKQVFATGAVNAAVFMKEKPAGMYDMGDLV